MHQIFAHIVSAAFGGDSSSSEPIQTSSEAVSKFSSIFGEGSVTVSSPESEALFDKYEDVFKKHEVK